MAKVSNEKKLEAVKDWLRENNIPFIENYKSNFGVTMELKIPSLMIAVFVSDENDDEKYNATLKNGKTKLYHIYKPFFIRESDTKAFVLEKLQNCCFDRMVYMQKKWQKEQEKKEGKV